LPTNFMLHLSHLLYAAPEIRDPLGTGARVVHHTLV
jgi:hypothetical protein